MTLTEQIEHDYLIAFKGREIDKVNVLRLLKSALKNEEINLGHTLSESEAQAVLSREAKKRKESIDLYTSAGRDDSAKAEQAELTIINSYLPQAMDEAALEAIVAEVLASTSVTQKSDMGKVMGELKQKLTNPADISKAAQLVSQKLG